MTGGRTRSLWLMTLAAMAPSAVGLAACGTAARPAAATTTGGASSAGAAPRDAAAPALGVTPETAREADAAPATPPPPAAAPPAPRDPLALPAGPVPGAPALVVERRPDADRCLGTDEIVHFFAIAGAPAVDADFAAAMTITSPTDLDFDPAHGPIARASMERINRWVEATTRAFQRAREGQEARIAAAAGGDDKAAAIAHIIVLERRFADLLATIQVPANVRALPPDLRDEALTAFCDALGEKAAPLAVTADDGARACANLLRDGSAGPGWWTPVCVPTATTSDWAPAAGVP